MRPTTILTSLLTLTPAVLGDTIPSDVPISSLLSTATAKLASGDASAALQYFDAAVSRDPSDYLTLFKRGAAYLSLGKSTQAGNDFDKCLSIRPDFEGALVQRAKLRARAANWTGAKEDYERAGKKDEELAELGEAETAASNAAEAEKQEDFEACVSFAGQAIVVAAGNADLRRLRSRCRFAQGDVAEGISDIQHVLHLETGNTEPHLHVSSMLFYALGEPDKGLDQIRKCLHSDPENKPCRTLMKREKDLAKRLKKLDSTFEKRQFSSATQFMIPIADSPGLIAEVKEDMQKYKDEGYIHPNAPNGLYTQLIEKTCQAYFEMNNFKRANIFCDEAATLNPENTFSLLIKAQEEIDADEFEAAVRSLNEAKDRGHPQNQKWNEMMRNAQTLLKRSKTKDYYKVIGVDRDASEKEIKRAYRKLTQTEHPDKAAARGVPKEEAEKKMAAINEAYEVLSDPELKQRFDNGDDPNDQESQMRGNPFQGGSPFGGFGGFGGGQQFVFRQGGNSFHFGGQGGFPGGGGFGF